MSEYLTSTESLEKLCEIQPDKSIKYGIGKTLAGIGLIGLGAAGVWLGRDIIVNSYDSTLDAFDIGIEVLLGAVTLASGGYGLYKLVDGITSIGKPLGIYSRDECSYYINGGFTNKPSISDKKFGSKVVPIEHTSELSSINDEYVLMNGIFVNKTSLESELKTRFVPVSAIMGKTPMTTLVPQPYTVYTAILDGELRNQHIRVYTVTEDDNFAKSLANKKKDSAIYAMGRLDKESDIDLKQFGDAFRF